MAWLLVVWLAIVAIAIVSLVASSVARGASRRAQSRRLRTVGVDELAREVQLAIRSEGPTWVQLPAAKAILERAAWTDADLLAALEKLWTALYEEDQRQGRDGRDSNYFQLYDCGIAEIIEALCDRLGIPQPWQRGAQSDEPPPP